MDSNDTKQLHDEIVFIPPPPREVNKDAIKGVADLVLTIIGGLFTVIGLIISWLLVGGLELDFLLDITGKTVEGEAIDLAENTSYTVNGAYPVKITYVYEVNGETLQGSTSTTNWALVERLETNPKLKIEYASWNTKLSRVEGTTRSMTGYAGLFILLFPMVGTTMLAVVWVGRLRRARIYRHGEGIMAKLESVGLNRSVQVNGRHPTLVRWSFEVRGTRYDGKWSGFKLGPLREDAAKIPVIYDPKDPKHSVRFWG